jgi:hypothetical protein
VVNDIRQPGVSLDDLPAIRNGRANEFLFCFSIAYKPQGPCKPGETVAIRRQPMAGVLQVNENSGFSLSPSKDSDNRPLGYLNNAGSSAWRCKSL